MTGKDATGNLSEEKGLTRTIQDAGWHRIPLVAAVAAVAVVALIELWFSRNTDHGTRRWEAGGTATETASFRHLAKPTGPGPFSPLLIYLGLAQGPTNYFRVDRLEPTALICLLRASTRGLSIPSDFA
jgi:hypothetical protein